MESVLGVASEPLLAASAVAHLRHPVVPCRKRRFRSFALESSSWPGAGSGRCGRSRSGQSLKLCHLSAHPAGCRGWKQFRRRGPSQISGPDFCRSRARSRRCSSARSKHVDSQGSEVQLLTHRDRPGPTSDSGSLSELDVGRAAFRCVFTSSPGGGRSAEAVRSVPEISGSIPVRPGCPSSTSAVASTLHSSSDDTSESSIGPVDVACISSSAVPGGRLPLLQPPRCQELLREKRRR